MKVLVIDDEAEVREVTTRALSLDGHVVREAVDLQSARAAVDEGVELIVLDLRLPDGFGLTLCRELRAAGSTIPVLLLTALSQVATRVEGLDAGADDFLAKPFAVAELRARVRALARRGHLPSGFAHQFEDVHLDFPARRATKAGKEVPVTPREWSILELLARRSGRVVSRDELLESVWGEASESAASSLEVLIARLRRKLGAGLIRTMRGEGYALEGKAP
ncbi:MAG: response regulator transcription factor [Archangium sp.]|nr:response regulator transcription factor [Archangium sp.]